MVKNHLTTELSVIIDEINEDFGRLSVDGIALAEEISAQSDKFFEDHNFRASELKNRPELIEDLLSLHMRTLISAVNNRYCGGAFIMLDATINPDSENADMKKSGIFLKKTLPTSTTALGSKVHFLRGPARIARSNGIMLLGQWKMEFDITNQDFFPTVMETARQNSNLPLSRLYYWSERVVLKGNSEAGFILCVPLRSDDGTIFGLCGIEISDRLFKSLYTPEGGSFENIFTVMAPESYGKIATSKGLIAGNYFLTGNRWQSDIVPQDEHDGFTHFTDGYERYSGISTPVSLYPKNSPYIGQKWSVAVLMPYELLHRAVKGNSHLFIIAVIVLILISLIVSLIISKHYLKPVQDAFDSIKKTDGERKSTPYHEINDLFEFLDSKDKEHEETLGKLHSEKEMAKSQYEQAQTYITHLADKRMPEISKDDFEVFIENLSTLTKKEREIFDLYLQGYKANEIMEILDIKRDTIKYHNKNIYSKLGVTSRKQLLEYATLLKYKEEE